MSNYLHDLAVRRPDLFTEKDRDKILADDRFNDYVKQLTQREQVFVIEEKAKELLNGRTGHKLLRAGTALANGPK